MSRLPFVLISLTMLLGSFSLGTAHADIKDLRGRSGEIIPGTEGITPGPGVDLSRRDLRFAELNNVFGQGSTLQSARLTEADLSYADLNGANVTEGDFSNALITGTRLSSGGFSKEQLYSTASYKNKNLQGVELGSELTGWNFVGQNLTGATFIGYTRIRPFSADLTDADFTDAIVRDAGVSSFSQEQLYSTASYKNKNMEGVRFGDVLGWDFSGQNLSGARFGSISTNTDFTDAVVDGVRFGTGFTNDQLYSTASYQNRNLEGISLGVVSGWNFTGQNLAGASFGRMTNTDFTDSVVANADFGTATSRGFTKEQLYSTASYKKKNLEGINLGGLSEELAGDGGR